MTASSILLVIAGIALFYACAPVVAGVVLRYREPRRVRCPETDAAAWLRIDACHAAATALVGGPELRVADCSRWPAREGCARECLATVGAIAATR